VFDSQFLHKVDIRNNLAEYLLELLSTWHFPLDMHLLEIKRQKSNNSGDYREDTQNIDEKNE
jgi:hypothetical protein